MPRRNNNPHPSRRINNRASSRANREARQPNVISVWRMVDDKFSSVIADCVHAVNADFETLPLFERVPSSHKVFILDPRRTKHSLAKGFEAGFNMRTTIDRVGEIAVNQPQASLGEVHIRRGRHLMTYISSPQLDAETRAAKEVLAEEGAKGFQSRKVLRSAGGAVIYLGQLSEGVRQLEPDEGREIRNMIIDQVDLAFAMQSEVDLSAVTFGDLNVKSRTQ